MKYFSITKTNKKNKMEPGLSLKEGYRFNQKIRITLYDNSMIDYILNKKINNTLKNIINMMVLLEEESDEDSVLLISAKLETLRKLLLEKYSRYINNQDTESYLKKIEKLEERLGQRKIKKNRHR